MKVKKQQINNIITKESIANLLDRDASMYLPASDKSLHLKRASETEFGGVRMWIELDEHNNISLCISTDYDV